MFPVCARSLCTAVAVATLDWVASCQEIPATEPAQPGSHTDSQRSDTQQGRHILGLIPNYRTAPTLQNYKPLTIGQKFKMASEDSLDRGTFVMAGVFGGVGQLTGSNKSFGQGAAGFGRYFGASYGDLLIGNYMTEAVYPSILHQDPDTSGVGLVAAAPGSSMPFLK